MICSQHDSVYRCDFVPRSRTRVGARSVLQDDSRLQTDAILRGMPSLTSCSVNKTFVVLHFKREHVCEGRHIWSIVGEGTLLLFI